MRALGVLALAACGSQAPSSAPAAHAAAASAIATAAAPGDEIVARVNGRPVWASCVAAQGALHPTPDARAALDECLAFELMAQEAERRTFAIAPDVIEATRAALVNRLVETGYEQRFATPADFGAKMDAFLAQNAWRMQRPELRASSYVRVNLPTPVAPAVEARGRALAETIYAALAPETGLLPADLADAAAKFGAGTDLEVVHANPPLQPAASLDASYAAPLFAIREVGRVTGPVRTPWGWDVILYADGLPARTITRAQLAEDAFPEFRRAQFTGWVNGIVKELDLAVVIDATQLDGATP